MTDVQKQQAEFMVAMGKELSTSPNAEPPCDDIILANKLVEEEMQELVDEMGMVLVHCRGGEPLDEDLLKNVVSEAADFVYVLMQYLNVLGLPFQEVYDAIHTANMKKMGPDGKPVYREDGKVLKPEGWQRADILAIIREAKKESI